MLCQEFWIPIQANVPIEFNVAEHVYDPDCPAQTLTFSLDACPPPSATIDSVTGRLDWTPTAAQAAQTDTLCLRVTNEGGLSTTQTILAGPFTEPMVPLRIGSIRFDATSLDLTLDGAAAGQTFVLKSTYELKNPPEVTVWTERSPFTWQSNPVHLADVIAGNVGTQFFRLKLSTQ